MAGYVALDEVGTLCTPSNSVPTGGSNSYGNPRFFGAEWQVAWATGQFVGLTGSGTSGGNFAGAAIVIRYDGSMEVDSRPATVRLDWDIVVNGALSTCEAVGASDVRVLLSGTSTTEMKFNCDQKSAQFVISAGAYTVEIVLVDITGAPLSLPVVQTPVFLPGQVFDLGFYTFAFEI